MRCSKTLLASGLILALGAVSSAQEVIPQHILLEDMAVGSPLDTDAENSRDIVIANFDGSGDGSLDIYVANLDQTNSLYLNNGTGVFTKSAIAGPAVTDVFNSRGLATADIDLDGDIDIFVANSLGQANNLYINQGGDQLGTTGTFLEAADDGSGINTDLANSRHAVFFNANADAFPDLFVTNFNGQDNFLYLNDGDGTFTKQVAGDAVSDGGVSYDVSVGNIDGDGDIDLFVTNHDGVLGGSGTANFLYTNDGTGVFTRVVDATNDATTDVHNSLGCAFGDFNNDGDLDLYVANDEGEKNNFYTNDGTGKFTAIVVGPLVEDMGNSISARFFDIDGRFKEDLFVANRITGVAPIESNGLYMNNGRGGGFGMSEQGFGPLEPMVGELGDTYGFAFGDLDGDSLVDIAEANFGSVNRIYRNLGRQWDAINSDPGMTQDTWIRGSNGRPILGGSGTLEGGTPVSLGITDGPSSGFANIYVGLSTSFAPFKGGIFVPAPDFAIAGFPLDLGGDGTLPGVMPGLPPGLTFFTQAWMPDPAAVTGLGATATNGLSLTTP
ncbi:MAG: FG-GAP repeat domain-containing protein [Planctomycetota bacterium]|jgi:hypothetical protein